jgi:hypothetical protein
MTTAETEKAPEAPAKAPSGTPAAKATTRRRSTRAAKSPEARDAGAWDRNYRSEKRVWPD